MGELHVTFSAPRSVFLPLVVRSAVGSRQPSSWDPDALISRVVGVPGRIVSVQEEPLLEAELTEVAAVAVRLYGVPGLSYALDVTSTSIGPEGWVPNWQGTLTSDSKEIVIPTKWSDRLFFRARHVPRVSSAIIFAV